MGTKTPQALLQEWKLEKITTEQAIGHILQNIVQLQLEQHKLNNALYEVIKQQQHTNSDQAKR